MEFGPGTKPILLFVGAFGEKRKDIAGGNLTDCRILMSTSFAEKLRIIKVDSTQISQPPPSLPVRLGAGVKRFRAFRRALDEERPDAVLIFSSSGLSFFEKSLMGVLAARRKTPVLFSIRSGRFLNLGLRSRAFALLAGRLLNSADKIICQGKIWQDFYLERLGFPRERCPIFPNWTVTDAHLALPLENAKTGYRPDKGPVTLLFLGWVERAKGIFELLEAARCMARNPSLPDFRLVIAGGGGALEEAKAWAEAQGLADRISFSGWVGPEACLSLFGECDVFVLPSHVEGLPNSMIEAMGAGRPVVVTPVGSIPDHIRDGENGLLVPVGEAEGLRRALERLLLDPDLRTRLGRAAREEALWSFTGEAAAVRLLGLIGETMAETASRPA